MGVAQEGAPIMSSSPHLHMHTRIFAREDAYGVEVQQIRRKRGRAHLVLLREGARNPRHQSLQHLGSGAANDHAHLRAQAGTGDTAPYESLRRLLRRGRHSCAGPGLCVPSALLAVVLVSLSINCFSVKGRVRTALHC